MNKSELVDAMATGADISKAAASKALDAAVAAIMTAVSTGDKVSLPGFGSFERRERAARAGKNPKTGEALTIEASTAPAFKAGTKFKEAVRG